MRDVYPLFVLVAGMFLLGLIGTLRRVGEERMWEHGDPVPIEQAEEWMLQALPGIGPRTVQDRLHALRQTGLEGLPKSARDLAGQVFIFGGESSTTQGEEIW